MKFWPRRFKETQMEWFGKRGISSHISYCVRRTSLNECEVSVFSHLFRQSISQNSEVVAAVMYHTLKEEKQLIEATVQDRMRQVDYLFPYCISVG